MAKQNQSAAGLPHQQTGECTRTYQPCSCYHIYVNHAEDDVEGEEEGEEEKGEGRGGGREKN